MLVAVEVENGGMVDLFLRQSNLDINRQDKSSRSALEVALLERRNLGIAKKLAAIDGLDMKCIDEKS